jgi:hypothetical protein
MEASNDLPSPSRLKRGLLLAAEIALIVTIIGLLLAIWLPGLIVPK